jgi:flagellar biosynthesis protein FlhG
MSPSNYDYESGYPSFHPEALSLPIPPRGQRRIITVGGGRGGVGKSIMTINLAVYLAQLGRSVTVVDADTTGANLHSVLGLDTPPIPTREQMEQNKLHRVETSVPGLMLMSATFDPTAMSNMRPGKRSFFTQVLKKVDCDYIVLDLGASTAPGTLDLFCMGDVSICVTIPEPPAIEATYRFLRALFLRRVRRSIMKERFKLRLMERALSELPPLPTPLEAIEALRRHDTGLADLGVYELQRLNPRLVVNGTRVRTDNDLGLGMQTISERFLGIDLDYIGHIEHDDAVWLTVRRRRPLLIDSPTSKGARLLERIARRVVALLTVRDARPSVPHVAVVEQPRTLYDVLGVSRGASDEEVRRAHKRQKELFSAGSLPLVSILTEEGLRGEQANIEEAYDTLLDPIRRRAYDLSTFPEDENQERPPKKEKRRGFSAEQLMLQAEIAREIHANTEYSGSFLRKVRESQGIEIAEIAAITKIAPVHLRAIEDEDFTHLPAVVYTRGFVREFAKFLKLDPAQVDRSYLKRLRAGLAALGRQIE